MAKSKIDQLYNRPKKSNKAGKGDAALLKTARERARDGATYWKDNWEAAEDDLKFVNGEQWPSQIRTERELEQRPCLTNNVLPSFVDQVLGDQRQNRPCIKVSPVDMVRVKTGEGEDEKFESLKISNEAGSKDYELAEVFSGLIKNIEYNCDAETSYDIAFQAAVESGIGYLRVRSDYLADDSFEQDLIIDHIENQFAVTIDPDAKERDRSDMNWCLIDEPMQKEKFMELYPDAVSDPVNSDSTDEMGTWYTEKTVRVSEYFTREPVTREAALMSNGETHYIDDIEKVVDEMLAAGVSIVRTRKVKTFKVMWRKITGHNVLEGPVELPCSTIPVVPVWGKVSNIKKKLMIKSLIRESKDAQRMANYWDSAATEAVALAPKAPFISAEGHTEGREKQWENANTTNYSTLTYIPQYQGDLGPRREQPAAIPAAEITLGMNSTDKIKATLGMFDASLGAVGNETSGRAIIARQRQGDRGTFVFIDNLTKAIRRIGKICVEMIPKIYDTERVVRLKFPDETEDHVTINKQIFDEDSGEWVTIHDLGVAKYDVVVTTGPAYSTQRQEAAEAMIQFAQAVPAAAAVMADLIALNMDWPGADAIADRLKKIIPPDVLSNEEREKLAEDAPEPAPPTPEQQVQMAEFEARGKEAEASMAESEAKVAESQADLVKAQLETEEAKKQIALLEGGQGVAYDQVRELVAQALAEVMATRQQTV